MNLRMLASSLALFAASQSLTGCFFMFPSDPPEVQPLPPVQQSARLHFTASRGCAPLTDACATDRPLLTGVREQVEITLPSDYTGVDPTVTASDPAVVEVGPLRRASAQGDAYIGTFDVRAGRQAGSTTLTVTGIDGASTTVTLRVEEAAGMDLVEDEGTAHYDRSRDHITLRVGERVSMNGYPVNRRGEQLYANDGVIWTVPSTAHVRLSWNFMIGARVADDHVYVEALSPGTEVITVRAGVVERTIVVEVR